MLPLKRHLLLLVLGALVPMLILAVALTALFVREDRRHTEEALHEHARLLSHALDAELSRSVAAMQALARSNSIQRGDLKGFYEEAREVRDALGLWDTVLLVSPEGEHLFNLIRPFGDPLPRLPQGPDVVRRVFEEGVFVSNALRGTLQDTWLMFIAVPAFEGGERKYVLAATMDSGYWSRWLAERAPKGYIASIIDRNYVVLARTKDAERLVGTPVHPWFRELLASREGGTVRGQGLVVPDLVVGFHRSELSGWHTNVITSGAVFDAPGRRSALLLAVGVALALAIAVALALWRARVLTRDIERVVNFLQSGLRAKNEELSQADRRKDEFLATLAHELRNPLAPIRTSVELLKRDSLPPGAAVQAREIIERQARHMTRMVDDLLELGRITKGELHLRKERLEVATAVRWAVEASQPAFDSADVRLSVELPDERLFVDADPTRLVQVLANLLGNAAKFTPPGGQAWISARRDGAWAEVRVRDNGIGIDAAQLPRLFQMFSQAKPALERSQGGLGIGLALARGLVERHGGTLEARSEGAGRGAEFIVRLPAVEAAGDEKNAPDAISSEKPKRKVLVADDNRDAADSLAVLLRTMGHDVRVAYDGEQALAAGAEFRPDALILDIGMPRANGYDVAHRARETEWGRGAKLIAVTGWGQERDKALAEGAGFDHHLTKPVDADELEALIR